ncbi:MAG: hypothetical protein II598_04505 [Elusimicrobia bacterium]|nr:hypothetical protein [Elusimicrobiota bacterium]
MFKKFIIVCLLIVSICLFSKGTYASTVTYLVDTPTYSILDYGCYDVLFRVFSGGGVLAKLNFGVFQILNLGVSWELGSLIGCYDVSVAVPALQVKCNIYSGDENVPGFAVGYDGQGFFYDKDDGDFIQKGKGIYLVAGKELFFPTLNINAGINMNDFKNPGVLGFINASYEILEESLMAMLEFDNIGGGKDGRLNLGFRVWITDDFDIDFILRNCTTPDQDRFGCERILKISYQSRF